MDGRVKTHRLLFMGLLSEIRYSLTWVESREGVPQRQVQLVEGGLLLVGQHLGLEYRMLAPQAINEGHEGS
jgi:hypothetical protein